MLQTEASGCNPISISWDVASQSVVIYTINDCGINLSSQIIEFLDRLFLSDVVASDRVNEWYHLLHKAINITFMGANKSPSTYSTCSNIGQNRPNEEIIGILRMIS